VVAPVVGNGSGVVVGPRPGPMVGGEVPAWLWVTDPPRVGDVDWLLGHGPAPGSARSTPVPGSLLPDCVSIHDASLQHRSTQRQPQVAF
jgi:hypothetical protein